MGYLATDRARERREDPRKVLPGSQSILLLGWPHNPPELSLDKLNIDPGGLKGRIASYAWSQDYHDVISPLLEQLVTFIQEAVGTPLLNRWYTDTGPILERDLAQQAGLGWIGKNTCLINPQQGSFLLLAEILLGLELEPDIPFSADHCGSCNRCIAACPTNCILDDRTIDASRCISYLTIELKGPIPVELRSQIGDWIFGCDICQQVCPWNQRFASQATADIPGSAIKEVDLVSELSLSPQEFTHKYKGRPQKRAKRRGYLRNVAVALGNSNSSRAVPPLVRALHSDPDHLVRGHAAWSLGMIGGQQAKIALEKSLSMEDEALVIKEIHQALDT